MTGRNLFTRAAAQDLRKVVPCANVKHCSELHLSVGLYEFEHAGVSDSAESWPDDVRRKIAQELAAWRGRNPGRFIVCTRMAIVRGSVDVKLFHMPTPALPSAARPAAAPRRSLAAGAAAPTCESCGG